MKAWLLVAALQVAALAVLAHRYMQQDVVGSPAQHNCGLLEAEEYVITSRRVVLPDGTQPAAGQSNGLKSLSQVLQSAKQHE